MTHNIKGLREIELKSNFVNVIAFFLGGGYFFAVGWGHTKKQPAIFDMYQTLQVSSLMI